jgi:hypothetical protein
VPESSPQIAGDIVVHIPSSRDDEDCYASTKNSLDIYVYPKYLSYSFHAIVTMAMEGPTELMPHELLAAHLE